jgi:hypothetical protein
MAKFTKGHLPQMAGEQYEAEDTAAEKSQDMRQARKAKMTPAAFEESPADMEGPPSAPMAGPPPIAQRFRDKGKGKSKKLGVY